MGEQPVVRLRLAAHPGTLLGKRLELSREEKSEMTQPRLDEIGYWSEIKLDIVREYAAAYSTILAKQQHIRGHVYIDAFAGAGVHISKTTGEFVPGSPMNALAIEPQFKEIHLIDLDGSRAQGLREATRDRPHVTVHEGDCNDILLKEIFPRVRYGDYKRGLCLLDPYGLNLRWEVVRTAGQSHAIEVFINFMVMDMNMNVLKKNRDKVDPAQIARMNSFWGDSSWEDAGYSKTQGLFEEMEEKRDNWTLAKAYQQRLQDVAGFDYVPDPIPMRNNSNAVIYYLFFASPNKTGAKIVGQIFDKYRDRRG
jgi:three-Cys-motif partner protein